MSNNHIDNQMMRLGSVIRIWRRASDLGVKDAARLFGISPATLSRLERHGRMDGKTLAKILRWLLSES